MDIKIIEEEKCINLLCSLLDSSDSLVISIGSNNTTLKTNDVVSSMLLEEMRIKNMEGLIHDTLLVRGQPVDIGKGKSLGRKLMSRGRSKFSG